MTAAPPPTAALPPIPVTVIGGYLGAGKTTLVNHLLRQAGGLRLAVLVNELGDLPIDADLIEARAENLISIAGGCICCSYGSDMMAALMDLARREPRVDHVLLETSGVALPGPVAASLTLLADYRNDAVVVLADAETVRARSGDRYLADTILRQLGEADLVLLNKADLVPPDALRALAQWLAARAPAARVLATERAAVALDIIAGTSLDRRAAAAPAHAHPAHDAATDYATLVLDLDDPLDPHALASALANPDLGLVRAKGFVRGLDGAFWSIQVVGSRGEAQPTTQPRLSVGRIVCIGLKSTLDRTRIAAVPARCGAAL